MEPAHLSDIAAALLLQIPGISALVGGGIARNRSRQNELRRGISADDNSTPTSKRTRVG
jgi:hypothetical protein